MNSTPARTDVRDAAPTAPTAAPTRGRVLLAVAAGGALGALARWALTEALPWQPGDIPSATLLANGTGSLLLGMLMGVLTGLPSPPALLHPFLGTGVLGGFTTFSAYAVETQELLDDGAVTAALLYLGGTLAVAVTAALVGVRLGRRASAAWT